MVDAVNSAKHFAFAVMKRIKPFTMLYGMLLRVVNACVRLLLWPNTTFHLSIYLRLLWIRAHSNKNTINKNHKQRTSC